MKQYTHRISRWLCGTTCHRPWDQERHRLVRDVNGREFWLLKHAGHSSYTDRVSKTKWCGTYYALYDIGHTEMYTKGSGWGGFAYGGAYVRKWDGRWSKAREAEMNELIDQIISGS